MDGRLKVGNKSDLDVPIKKFAKKKKKLVRNNAMQVQVVDPQLLDDINKSCGHKDIEKEVCIQVQDTQNQGEEHFSGHNKKRKRKQLVTREPLQKGGMSSKNANTLGKNKVEITLNPRHTVQQFMQLIKGLEGQDDKLRAIRDMGFGGLMHLNFPRNDTIFAAKLMRDFDPYGMCILLDRNRDIKVDAIDVHLVYGISIGGEVIVEGKDEDEKFYELLENWKQYHGGGVPSLKAIVEKLLNHGVNVDDNWRRSFLVLVVNTCIKSNSNTQPLYRFLSTTFDTTRISSYDWCKYTLDSLSEWAIYWKKNTTRFFPGPLPFLMICYFDRLQRQTFSHTRLFPLISSWRLEDIKKRISSESEYGFGCGALLDRIEKPVNMDISIPTHLLSEEGQSCQRQCEEEQHPQVDDPQSTNEQQNHKHQAEEQEHLEPPSNLHEINTQLREATLNIALCFVRVTTLLKSVENFYPNTLINNIMMQNVATMWSRCSGSQMPPDIQQFSKKCVGGSLLSQDNEIFSSEWFGEMVDSAVKRVVGESEQVLPCCGEEQPTPLQPLIFNSDTHHPMNENHSESDLNFDNLDFNEIFGDEDNANDQQCDHNLEKVTKRMRKLPAIFKSPYLIQYSHLVDEEEDDKICILEYALSAKLPKE
ncbi:hypothetical protein BVRB_9g215470 isoform A [Beta vulgaris subsp. vulgaris]|nr:hypothetical protein BVRB_9g215470 isoform A [Beta vulgaris subsp. vulgaris]